VKGCRCSGVQVCRRENIYNVIARSLPARGTKADLRRSNSPLVQ
jgi:hypothetical protein